MTKFPMKTLVALACLATLAACGGGGPTAPTTPTTSNNFNAACSDGSSKTSAVSQADAAAQCQALTASTIVTIVPAATYMASSEELAAFTLLNAERSRCGFGLLAQNTKLDLAAKSHAEWSLINNLYGHYEAATVPTGFTGVEPKDRIIAAGYAASSATETMTGSVANLSIGGYGVESTRALMAMPYHMFGMMSPYRDIGVSVRSASSVIPLIPNGLSRTAVFDFGVIAENYQTPPQKSVLTYPCEGSTGVATKVTGEYPNPVPGRDLAANPLGHAILVMLPKGQELNINSSTMTKVADGSSVPMRSPITAKNDPNKLFQTFGSYMGYVAPDVALQPATAYHVTVTGTSSGLEDNCPAGSLPTCVKNPTGTFTTTFNFSTGN